MFVFALVLCAFSFIYSFLYFESGNVVHNEETDLNRRSVKTHKSDVETQRQALLAVCIFSFLLSVCLSEPVQFSV